MRITEASVELSGELPEYMESFDTATPIRSHISSGAKLPDAECAPELEWAAS